MVIAKYEKIHQALQSQILAGKFNDGKLPPLAALTKIFKANPATVSKAVKLLEQEKLVQCGPGSVGTVINQNEVRQRRREKSFYAGGWDKAACLRYLVFHGVEEPHRNMYEEQIKAFQARYPGIEIELVSAKSRELLEWNCDDVDVFQYCAREKDFRFFCTL
jgi:DNA-binding transcriptional MocR family regulator